MSKASVVISAAYAVAGQHQPIIRSWRGLWLFAAFIAARAALLLAMHH